MRYLLQLVPEILCHKVNGPPKSVHAWSLGIVYFGVNGLPLK